MTEKEQKGLKLISLFISSIRNIIGQEGTFMDEKGTTLLLGMIEKEQKGLKLKVEGT